VSTTLNRVHGIDAQVARAKRAIARSKILILHTNEELARHERWLNRHCMVWAKDVRRDERILAGKRQIAESKRLKCNRKADGWSCPTPSASRLYDVEPHGLSFPSRKTEKVRLASGTVSSLVQGRIFARALGVIAFMLVIAGMVRATMAPQVPAETVVPKMPGSPQAGAALPARVAALSQQPLAPASGFSVVTMAVPEPLPLSGNTIGSRMLMASASASATRKPQATNPSIAEAPPRPESKARPKLAKRDEQLPWLRKPKATTKRKLVTQKLDQQLPWLREPTAKAKPKAPTQSRYEQLPWLRSY
jgi:hypothetical protein